MFFLVPLKKVSLSLLNVNISFKNVLIWNSCCFGFEDDCKCKLRHAKNNYIQ